MMSYGFRLLGAVILVALALFLGSLGETMGQICGKGCVRLRVTCSRVWAGVLGMVELFAFGWTLGFLEWGLCPLLQLDRFPLSISRCGGFRCKL